MANEISTCKHCDGQFKAGFGRVYCSTNCSNAVNSARPSSAVCKCFWCDVTFNPKRIENARFCGRDCFFAWKAAKAGVKAEHSASHRVKRSVCKYCSASIWGFSPSKFCGWLCRSRSIHQSKSFDCRECQAKVVTEYGDKRTVYCGDMCGSKYSRRIRKAKERARMRLARVENVDPIKVFTRDAWQCQICQRKTPRAMRGTYKPNAPELDHIIPLSKGGNHEYANTQCACRSCNAEKGDTIYGQVPMVGV